VLSKGRKRKPNMSSDDFNRSLLQPRANKVAKVTPVPLAAPPVAAVANEPSYHLPSTDSNVNKYTAVIKNPAVSAPAKQKPQPTPDDHKPDPPVPKPHHSSSKPAPQHNRPGPQGPTPTRVNGKGLPPGVVPHPKVVPQNPKASYSKQTVLKVVMNPDGTKGPPVTKKRKTRSKQKNIRKDTRPDHLKPSYRVVPQQQPAVTVA